MKRLHKLIAEIIFATSFLINPASANNNPLDVATRIPIGLTYDPLKENSISSKTSNLILYRADNTDSQYFAGHRSHRSHSSHRSHYSSSGSGHRSHFSHYSSNNTTAPSNDNNSNSQSPSNNQNTNQTAKAHKLGSRVLAKGMSGDDVVELRKLLNSKGYTAGTSDKFDELLEVIVKDFQGKMGIPVDGMTGPLTLYYLKNTK